MHHPEEAASCLFVARRQPTKLFEAAEETLDLVAVAVQVSVNQPDDFAVLFAGNDELRPQRCNGCYHGIGVVAFVGQYVTRALGGEQQVRSPATIGLLAGAEHHVQRNCPYNLE